MTGFRIRFTANSPRKSKSREFERFHLPVRRGFQSTQRVSFHDPPVTLCKRDLCQLLDRQFVMCPARWPKLVKSAATTAFETRPNRRLVFCAI